MRDYIDGVGLNVDITALLEEFFASRLFIRKSRDRVSFRYRAVLEYFIAQQMYNDPSFREWVLDDSRYLSFINEIQYFAGKIRNDAELLKTVESRFEALIGSHETVIGEINLNSLTELQLPKKSRGVLSVEHLTEQLSSKPLSEFERDKELEVDIPRDVEGRQEVFRPKIDDAGQQFLVALMLYSGALKNLELINDNEKRRHLYKIWRGWGILLHQSLQAVDELARTRRIRINGVLYECAAPLDISDSELARLIALNMRRALRK
jgi:hypothetical protein